jgi:hypothetical protein
LKIFVRQVDLLSVESQGRDTIMLRAGPLRQAFGGKNGSAAALPTRPYSDGARAGCMTPIKGGYDGL